MNANLKNRMRLLSRFGKSSFLVGAAVVTGFALRSTHGRVWGDSLRATSETTTSLAPNAAWDYNWDRRGSKIVRPVSLEPKGSKNVQSVTAKRHILLIRHGQYKEDGETDNERILTETGKFQARITGKRLHELKLPYLRMVTSTMTRAQETAQLVRQAVALPSLMLEFDDVLEEGAPADPVPPTESWNPHPCQFFQDSARIENAFRKYFHRAEADQRDDSYEVIVCHANVIRFFVCRALQFPLSGWIRISLANCSLTMVTIHADGLVVVEMMGDHGHIPADSVTYH